MGKKKRKLISPKYAKKAAALRVSVFGEKSNSFTEEPKLEKKEEKEETKQETVQCEIASDLPQEKKKKTTRRRTTRKKTTTKAK